MLTKKGLERMLGTATRQNHPITPAILPSTRRLLDLNLTSHALTWALFTVAFFSFLRKSNLVSPKASTFGCNRHLARQDMKFTGSGCLLRIKWSKTRQCKDGIHIVPLPSIPNSALCPVTAIQHYFTVVPAAPHAPFFCFLSAHGPTPGISSLQLLSVSSASWASIRQTILLTVSAGAGQHMHTKPAFLTISYNFMGTGSPTLTNAPCHYLSLNAPALPTLWPRPFTNKLCDLCSFPTTIFSHVWANFL